MNVLRKTMQTISSPGTPAAFQTRIYLQSDHRIFWKNTIFDCKSKKERSPYGLLTASCQSSKKKLKILYEHQIVRAIGINPKYWKFDEYNFQRMDEDDPVYRLLCSFDDVDFDRYFKY